MGVFLEREASKDWLYGLPHVRGGVSSCIGSHVPPKRSSPRAWGCFPFDIEERNGVWGLPHVRGGVSETSTFARGDHQSSPRAWGCFFPVVHAGRLTAVFPTCVGVFLFAKHVIRRAIRLPHVRGGVSSSALMRKALRPSSPRAWGCFSSPDTGTVILVVFPTCVGVFLAH